MFVNRNHDFKEFTPERATMQQQYFVIDGRRSIINEYQVSTTQNKHCLQFFFITQAKFDLQFSVMHIAESLHIQFRHLIGHELYHWRGKFVVACYRRKVFVGHVRCNIHPFINFRKYNRIGKIVIISPT